jgi:hypothetical protein
MYRKKAHLFKYQPYFGDDMDRAMAEFSDARFVPLHGCYVSVAIQKCTKGTAHG